MSSPAEHAATVREDERLRMQRLAAEHCTGADSCDATFHIHGCFADSGRCDMPHEHEARAALTKEPA